MAESNPSQLPGTESKPDGFHSFVSPDSDKFQPESGRYHLYVAYACPFAHRALLARSLKGLQEHIGLSIVHPTFQKTKPDVDDHVGWVFKNPDDEPLQSTLGHGSFSCKECIPDTVNNAKTIRELYEMSGGAGQRYTVPILWDKKNKVIVNNDSGEIARMFNSAFNNLAKNPQLDLCPEELRESIDSLNKWVHSDINSVVYKAGHAATQQEYDNAYYLLFDALDELDDSFGKSRYMIGNQLTEVDLRLFPTLLRFDEIYYVLFKCNKKRIIDYPNLLNYVRDIYQMPGVAETINMEQAKIGYYSSKTELNKYAIVPIGPYFIDTLMEKHDRDRFTQ